MSTAQTGFQGAPVAHSEKLSRVLAICQEMNSARDLGNLLDLVARQSAELLEADRASIFLLDRANNELWSKVALGSEETLRFDARLGIAGSVVMSGEASNVAIAADDPRFYSRMDELSGYETRSVLTVPLRTHQGEVVGAFQVLNKHSGGFTSEDEEILKTLAVQVAITIENVRLFAKLQQRKDELEEENTHLRHEVEGLFSTHNIVGTSHQIQSVIRLIEQIRDSSVNVLITGESGTGKELVARAIHYNSARAQKPFIALNCAALPDDLVESELFGIEKGVATGVDKRIGRFESAAGGTLFLDEIGDLSLKAQAKILRALQENVVERVGSARPIAVDVRVLAATNKDLDSGVRDKSFREDLYYRLNVVRVRLPALREIGSDIPVLAEHFLAKICADSDKPLSALQPDAVVCLQNYDWPGNIRQLENEMRRLVAVIRRKRIVADDLADEIRAARSAARKKPAGSNLHDAVSDLEAAMISEALAAHKNNQFQAAQALGLSRQGLINKIKRYGLGSAGG